MKTVAAILLVLILLGGKADAQAPATAAPARSDAAAPAGELEVGVRVSESAAVGRFMRDDDLRSGATLQRLRYVRLRDAWRFTTMVSNPGYRDQRYTGMFEQFGRLRASFDYTEVPIWFGNVERTPYVETSPGVFRLDDAVQLAVQGGGSATLYSGGLRSLDMRALRRTADGRVQYSVTPHLDLSLAVKSSGRSGQQPWGASFGLSAATVVPLSLDRRSNDVSAAAEWSNRRGMIRFAYDGSWFDNHTDTLVWDNPFRATDITSANAYSTGLGSSQGRMALWPDSTAHTVSGAGSLALPGRSRLVASLSVGTWLQDDALLPFTINSAIAPLPLPRDTAKAKAVITSMNYRYTGRPTPNTWFTANYRLYDFDNQSEPFPLTNVVRLDGTLAASPAAASEPFGYRRQFGDVDVSYTRFRGLALRAGYGVERDHRTYRYVETTTDHQARASLDSTGLPWGSVRLLYDHSYRAGRGLDEQVFEDIDEQVSLRQFDIANRNRDRVSLIVQYLPTASLGISGSASLARERRPESAFGLQDNDVNGLTIGVQYTPATSVIASLEYGYDAYGTLQRSRQANPPPDPTFNDPRRDWQTDMDEKVHTISASVDLADIAPRVSLRLGYEGALDNVSYVYTLAPESTLTPVQQLPSVSNRISLTTADLKYTISRRLALGVGYRLDHFSTSDFALSPAVMNTPFIQGFFNLLYQWRPYDVHSGVARVIYQF